MEHLDMQGLRKHQAKLGEQLARYKSVKLNTVKQDAKNTGIPTVTVL